MLRFINNVRAHYPGGSRTRITGSLSVNELQQSLTVLTQLVQQQSFSDEYYNLKNNIPLNQKNKLFNKIAGLNIFLDKLNIIRVGGRWQRG